MIVPEDDTKRMAGTVSDKREMILNAALHLFTTRGFHATPTSRISTEAGVSTGTLFHYFPDKNFLIDQLYLTLKKEMADIVRRDDDPSVPIKTRLERGFIRYIQWGVEHPEKARFIEQFHHSPNISNEAQKEAYEEYRWMKESYSQAIREGVLPGYPVEYHMVMTLQILNGILDLIRSDYKEMSVQEIITAGLEKIWR